MRINWLSATLLLVGIFVALIQLFDQLKKKIELNLIGMYEECEKFLRISLTAVEEQFGRYSIELAHELNKFTDVLLELAKDRRDLSIVHDLKSHLDNASLIYQIHYGAWSSNFKEIVQKKDRVAVLESGIQSQSRK